MLEPPGRGAPIISSPQGDLRREADLGVGFGFLHAGSQGRVAFEPAIEGGPVDLGVASRGLAGVADAERGEERLDPGLGGFRAAGHKMRSASPPV